METCASLHWHAMTKLDVDVKTGWFLLARLVLYLGTATLAVHGVVVAAQAGIVAQIVQEWGAVEMLQVFLAALGFCGFVAASLKGDDTDVVLELAAAGLLFITIRELDYVLDLTFGYGTYKYLNTPVCLWAAYVMFRSRNVLARQVATFVQTPAGFLSLFGLFMIVLHGQVMGQRELWVVLAPRHEEMKLIKRTVEETLELPGYFYLVFASCEAMLRARRRRREILGLTS